MLARSAADECNGSVIGARGSLVVYKRGFGFANWERKIPNDPHTKFEIGSNTWQVTALLAKVYGLPEEGITPYP